MTVRRFRASSAPIVDAKAVHFSDLSELENFCEFKGLPLFCITNSMLYKQGVSWGKKHHLYFTVWEGFCFYHSVHIEEEEGQT